MMKKKVLFERVTLKKVSMGKVSIGKVSKKGKYFIFKKFYSIHSKLVKYIQKFQNFNISGPRNQIFGLFTNIGVFIYILQCLFTFWVCLFTFCSVYLHSGVFIYENFRKFLNIYKILTSTYLYILTLF